ncbi:mandelate racemase/muconate lactonizing enzyme family protein [Propionivibrio dicarboxylicus]|uniref:L-alanine-DL-glutamate epimerase n=1 Tax=Propionivibrio dicarboxylicus TaxID=83767 RepID=A0A1G8J0F4_9RHOO|nr:mandelate racemase/muconate lactonizing enzyme family protein [Propionivibrio dicarboxylicus]SDI24437.1 L-alanine-DL-glutamate epimerase [Propionivibrio dicarboxylicus]
MSSSLIKSVTCFQVRLPFDHGAPAPLFAGVARTTLDSGWIRIELADGTVGWGESYSADLDALSSIFRNRVAPLAEGRDALDPTLMPSLERALHLMGRSGPVIHALSGLDIALWDIRGKLAGVPVYELLGGGRRTTIPAYASLLQYYGNTDFVQRNVSRALNDGYQEIKLHEKTANAVNAARSVMSAEMPLMVDVNCAWTIEDAISVVREMAPSNPYWIEEPTWPPEDIRTLQALRSETEVLMAAGENASSVVELSNMVTSHAVDFVQPSAVKCGGLSALWKIAKQCESSSVRLAPHSSYFGPGFLATLHALAAHPQEVTVERIYCDLGFVPYRDLIPMKNGAFQLTDLPGLGADPEEDLIQGNFVKLI